MIESLMYELPCCPGRGLGIAPNQKHKKDQQKLDVILFEKF